MNDRQSYTDGSGAVGVLLISRTQVNGDCRADAYADSDGHRDDGILQRIGEGHGGQGIRAKPGNVDAVYDVVE